MAKQIFKQSIGLDVSKDSISACFSQRQSDAAFRILSSRTFSSNEVGFNQLKEWINKHHQQGVPLHFLMEATGVYYEELAYFLKALGYRISVLLPNKTAAYSKSLDGKSKTDKADAKKLAQMALERDLLEWTPPSATMLKIKRLCREREEIMDEKTAFQNRLHARNHAHESLDSSNKRTVAIIDFLEENIQCIEKEIQIVIQTDAAIQERIEKVITIKGIGIVTAAIIISEANGFTLFNNKGKLVSYSGYDVVEQQSGTSICAPTRISKKGNYRMRKALHFPALVAVKHMAEMTDLYQRVFDRTKIKMKAYVAVQRKLLVLIYTLYKNNTPYQTDYKKLSDQQRSENLSTTLTSEQNRQELCPA